VNFDQHVDACHQPFGGLPGQDGSEDMPDARRWLLGDGEWMAKPRNVGSELAFAFIDDDSVDSRVAVLPAARHPVDAIVREQVNPALEQTAVQQPCLSGEKLAHVLMDVKGSKRSVGELLLERAKVRHKRRS